MTILAAALSLALRRYLADTPFVLFFAAVGLSAWYGGLGPGLLSTILGSLAGGFIFLSFLRARPIFGVTLPAIPVASFAVVAALIAILIALVRSAQGRAEAARQRAVFLAEASSELARSLDYAATLQRVAHLAIPRFADWCAVYVLEDRQGFRQVAVAATNPSTEERLRELTRRYPVGPRLQTPLAMALRTGEPQLISEVSDAFLRSIAQNSENLAMLRALGARSGIAVPLVARGQILGALVLARAESGLRYEPADLTFAEELARRAALAVDNARLYQEAQTALRRRDEALALLDTLLASAPIGLAFLDRDFRFVRLNDALAEMIGMSRQEILGRTVPEVVPPLWPTLRPILRSVLETGEPAINLEIGGETLAAPGVRRTWLVSYYPIRVHQAEMLGIGVVVVEITERKRAEEERQRFTEEIATERSWLRTVIERSPVGIILVEGTSGERILANQRAEELFGHPFQPTGGIAQYVGQVCEPDGTPYPYEDLAAVRALHGETVSAREALLRRPTGREVPILVNAAPIRDATGHVLGAVVAFEDISALKELERLREEWTSIIAHDLRQPVTIIIGYADLLRRLMLRQASPEEQGRSLDHIRTAASNLNRMIADLLDISRIEARRLTLEKQPVDLPALVRAVVERMAEVTKGHPVRVEIEGPVPTVEVDPARIEQVLDNLISNAAKYGYPNTDIVVRVERRDGEVQVSVTNRGDGILPEDLPKLFTRFYRTRVARERRVAGLGLGLYITKGLVEAHGGRIWVESIPGQTTTFHFSLPIPCFYPA